MEWKIILYVITLTITTNTYAQNESLLIKGVLKEQGTDVSIPFANIWITNSSKGTAANGSGEFIISIDSKYRLETLKISCIGYHSRFVSIDSIKNISPLILILKADASLLDEVVIKEAALNPKEIIKKAVESVNNNYICSPFNMEFYSKTIATDISTNKEFKIETILFGFSEGYSSSKKRAFEIIQKRTSGDDPLKVIDYEYWPTFEIHNVDQISSSFKQGVINLKHLDKFDLKYAGVSIFDEDTVFNIEYFAPKPTKEITGYGIVPRVYKGSIYITTSTNAIVKHEITTDQFSYSIIYKKLEGKYFPYYISGERRTARTITLSKITNAITLRSIETKNVKIIDYKTNEFGNVNQVKFDEDYWNTNYPIDPK
jgi:hypothetical protein